MFHRLDNFVCGLEVFSSSIYERLLNLLVKGNQSLPSIIQGTHSSIHE